MTHVLSFNPINSRKSLIYLTALSFLTIIALDYVSLHYTCFCYNVKLQRYSIFSSPILMFWLHKTFLKPNTLYKAKSAMLLVCPLTSSIKVPITCLAYSLNYFTLRPTWRTLPSSQFRSGSPPLFWASLLPHSGPKCQPQISPLSFEPQHTTSFEFLLSLPTKPQCTQLGLVPMQTSLALLSPQTQEAYQTQLQRPSLDPHYWEMASNNIKNPVVDARLTGVFFHPLTSFSLCRYHLPVLSSANHHMSP